ncbi:MAG: hypothetical protein FVQ84_09995 [Planctomycetes bacterium]|nr:hypothetical protein [Planctomycetota bacterium]
MDPDIALDSEVISLLDSVTQKELKEIKRGINAGVIKAWIDTPPVVVNSMLGYLLPFEKKLIVKWVEDNESAWQEYVAGSSKSYCYNEYRYRDKEEGGFLWNISWSHLIVVRQLSRLGVWRSRIDLEQGRTKQALEDCIAVARTGSHWQRKRTLIEQLIGMGIGSIANDGIFHIVANQRFSITELEQLQIQLSQIYQEDYPFMDMEYQKLAFLDVVQHSFTDGGPGGGHLIPRKEAFFDDMYEDVVGMTEDIPFGRGFFKNATLTSMCLLHARRDATVEFGRQIYDKQDMVASMSPYERHKRNLISTEEIILSMPMYRYALLYHLMPAVDRVSNSFYRGKALHEATIATLAIQRWRLEKEEYPTTLDELIEAGYLKELPKDPYSDKALIYKKIEDNFVLYSIGRNFKDDGGKVFEEHGDVQEWGTFEEGDAVFWPVAKLR